MTVALKGRIFNLRFEFIADAPIFLFFLTAAGTKSAGAPEPVPNCIDKALDITQISVHTPIISIPETLLSLNCSAQ